MKKETNKNLPVIILENTGIKSWHYGAYTFAFVYSNKGNFLIKGYYKEINEYLEVLKKKGYKYFVNFTLLHFGLHRSIWSFYKDTVYINEPEIRKPKYTYRKKQTRWEIRSNGKQFSH